ncbi:MAG TPA: NADPH-dependent 7-cyano-7-deazaguanine reductase QueF [Casimicrobiaceae bacterium]|nr:NADPH-dependent 7-cyano-7-deazaguanine reductase QueF [Casimicrobiaceae bacterium]
MSGLADSPLGRGSALPERYDPSQLFAVERAEARATLGLASALPFIGHDAWTAWELAWLDASGRPQVAVGRFEVPATSPRIVESKSVKLYLASLNHERLESREACAAIVARDLSAATGGEVRVTLALPPAFGGLAREPADGASIDAAPLAAIPDAPDAARLATTAWDGDETLHTSLFRSVCPVTGQPDYATVILRYRGPRIERGSLLAYLIGYRRHAGFHEHCVERIFVDVLAACRPNKLAVEARFTRRGGLDINPFRTSESTWRARSAPDVRQ